MGIFLKVSTVLRSSVTPSVAALTRQLTTLNALIPGGMPRISIVTFCGTPGWVRNTDCEPVYPAG